MRSFSPQGSLQGRTVVITGATRGIGRGIAIGLGEYNAHVVITGRTKSGSQSLESTADAVTKVGGTCATYIVDHSNDNQVKEFFDTLATDLKRQGRTLDVLVNNAYAGVPYIVEAVSKEVPFWERYTVPDRNDDPGAIWDCVNNVGARGNYVSSVYATRLMKDNDNGGVIVNVSSLGSLVSLFDPVYCAGKAAVDRMTAEFASRAPPHVKYLSFWPGLTSTTDVVEIVDKTKSVDKNYSDSLPDWNYETPLFAGRTLGALLCSQKLVSQMHGRVVLSADVGERFQICDENGFRPLSVRSLRFSFMAMIPFLRDSFLNRVFPRNPSIPWWMVRSFAGAIKYW